MSAFLSPDDLRQLTGHARRHQQIAWLRSRRVRHYVNARGAPVVALAWIGIGDTEPDIRVRPNLAAVATKW